LLEHLSAGLAPSSNLWIVD